MPPKPFKFFKAGRETRRFTFPDIPTWLALETRISSLFDIPPGKVAVSYEDHEGDMVTMSSQEELGDYFANFHKDNEPVKFTVIDLQELRAARGEATGNAEEVKNEPATGRFPSMGETLYFDADDDWQRVPGMQLFGMDMDEATPDDQPHAYVEAVESDASGSKKPSVHSLLSHPSVDTLTSKNKGKGKAEDTMTNQTKATSEVSIVEEEQPSKPPVHVYDVSDAGGLSPRTDPMAMKSPLLGQTGPPQGAGMPRNSVFGGDFLAPLGFSSPRADSEKSKPLPKTPSSQPVSFQPSTTSSTQSTPRQYRASDPPPPPSDSTAGPRSAGPHTAGPIPTSGPSFVNDVANLLDGLSAAVAGHPELSEGLRNIVKNTVQGTYFNAERERVANAAENVRLAAEETSERIARAAGNMATYPEQEAGRRIAQALSGVFKVIGELSSGISNLSAPPTHDSQPPANEEPPTAQPRPSRPPPEVPLAYPPPPARAATLPGGWPGYTWPPPPHIPLHSGLFGPPPGTIPPPFGPPPVPPPPPSSLGPIPPPSEAPRASDDTAAPSNRPRAPWDLSRVGSYPLQRSGTWSSRYDPYMPPYFTGYPFDPYAEPYHHRLDAHESKSQLEAAKALYKAEKERFRQDKEERRKIRQEIAQKRAEEGKKPRDGEREETIVARIALPSPSKGPSRGYAEVVSVPAQQPRQLGSSNPGAIPVPIPPLPKPVIHPPPVSSHGGGMSNLFDRIMGRLADMGLTPYTHPDMVNILNEIVSPNGEPTKDTEEDIIAKMVHRLNIRGSPSPRPSGSRLPQ